MNRQVIFAAAALISAFPAGASFPNSSSPSQDSTSSQSQPAPLPSEEPKKTKKVWTNDNMGDVNASAISLVGDAKKSSPGKSTAPTPTPASPHVVAAFRKQFTALQAKTTAIETHIAELKSFSKGETPGANGMQLHKGYSTESVDDQVRKLEEKKKSLAAQMDAVYDAARKRGVEPGQLR